MGFIIFAILFLDIGLIFGSVDDMYIGALLYFLVYFLIYIGLKIPLKLGIIFNIFYFTWVIVRPLILLYIFYTFGFYF